jgi:hypothetical protein
MKLEAEAPILPPPTMLLSAIVMPPAPAWIAKSPQSSSVMIAGDIGPPGPTTAVVPSSERHKARHPVSRQNIAWLENAIYRERNYSGFLLRLCPF